MRPERAGLLYALAAYLSWGILPIYWKALSAVSNSEILAHRIIWATFFLFGLAFVRNGKRTWELLRGARRHLPALVLSASLIGVNWFTYIYAVNTGNVLGASFGYFMSPLFSVFLGRVFLGERLTAWQWVSVGLAGIGVAQLVLAAQVFPAASLILFTTFGFYGLVRKRAPLEPLVASAVESAVLAPVSLAYLVYATRFPAHGHSAGTWSLLLLSGAVTALPLLWFAEGAKRLKLSSMGFFQYLSPSMQFLLAVALYGETFTPVHARAFGFIWVGLAIFAVQMGLGLRLSRQARAPELGKALAPASLPEDQ
ncbi:MAG TPA: EamA family transporter RarD [Bdellovibrionota bacterium]|nr:EamA family transporter RarD [Bdellovibrionota bacterium]